MNDSIEQKITYFDEDLIKGIPLPEKFTFPFYYTPHPLTEIAAKELQNYLEKEFDLEHNFGIDENSEGLAIGKMFGVLVVQDKQGKIGYLSAFSGKLAGSNLHEKFVPPVFDMLTENSFFLRQEEILNNINRQIDEISSNPTYINLKSELEQFKSLSEKEINSLKKQLKVNKENRKKQRETQRPLLNEEEYALLEADLVKQSLRDKHQLKSLIENWRKKLEDTGTQIGVFDEKINFLKKERKEKSAALQQQLFEQYSFLNKEGKEKSLAEIFSETTFGKPPAAAGECATPKLLQYAFQSNLKPLAMAEFWWGASPKSEIRKHKQYYAACSGKCKPILKHMLDGIPLEDNPLLENLGKDKQIEILYEDDSFVVVNKPAELLSVPGIEIQDSVYSRLKSIFNGIEPLIIHRLDMSTSGLLVVAKTKDVHKHIQRQFLKRKVTKRYTALLSGIIERDEGEIRLPLRGDLDDRPRQLVCFEFGKKAVTQWKVIQRYENTTKVHFWPLTGRTHQLRVHAAHKLGLDAPIVGDDLYGTASNRLHLHAAFLSFVHPKTKEVMNFEAKEEF